MGIHSRSPRPRNGLSLCSGAGGLDMGLMLAEPGFHTRCFVEWEEYPRRALIAAQRAGYFAPAPIWDDVTTFDAKPLAGAIDTLLAGYPCQPFSLAGQRRGENDERHLWPHVARIIREVDPDWVFLENVAGHLTLGCETVLRELWDMGRTPAAGIFSAGETGAPHERQRLFIVAHRAGAGFQDGRQSAESTPSAEVGARLVAKPQRCGREHQLAHAERDARYERRCGSRINSQAGTDWETNRASASSETVHPPGPGNIEGWRAVLRDAPHLAPAVSLRDVKRAADHFAALVARGVMEEGAAESIVRGMASGLSNRTLALRALGNGVHPLAAAHAWRTLSAAHGLGRVDLGAASKNPTAAEADELVLTNH